MKQIVMLQGMGNNERGWARLVSSFGRVVLIQQGPIRHVEIWEDCRCVFNGPEINIIRNRKFDEITLGVPTILRSMAYCREFMRGQTIDVLIAANYNMGMAALLLRLFGKTRKAVVFLTDFLPPRGSLAVRLHRGVIAILTRFAARCADEVWTVSPRIPNDGANPRTFVVPICIDDNQMHAGPRDEIGYIGFPSPDHALDVLFDIGQRHGIRINIIGDSPYLQSIKHLAPPGTIFHGMTNDAAKINGVFSRCFCGYAVYRNTGPQSYSYFGIPSKTFYCFASNTPVVTSNTAHFTQNIEKFSIGCVVEPKPEEIEKAILQIKNNYETYSAAIDRFRSEWNNGTEAFHRERMSVLLNG